MSYDTPILLNDFAIRSFRNTADQDYIHARLAYKSGLIPQFLWSSLHCLEKYGKCILLLNRIDGKNIKHELSKSLKRINNSGILKIELPEESLNFIKRLESCARFRYLEVSWYNLEHDIVRLDMTVSIIRRYCQVLNYSIKNLHQEEVSLFEINMKEIKNAELSRSKKTCIFSGVLETILKDKSNLARSALVWKNLYFGTSNRKGVKMKSFWKSENAPLLLHPEILDEVIKYVYLPKDVIEGYKSDSSNQT
jgi:hypothetical protein